MRYSAQNFADLRVVKLHTAALQRDCAFKKFHTDNIMSLSLAVNSDVSRLGISLGDASSHFKSADKRAFENAAYRTFTNIVTKALDCCRKKKEAAGKH